MRDKIPGRLSWVAGRDVAGTSRGMVNPPEGGSQVQRRVFLRGGAGVAGLPLVSRLAAPAGGVAVLRVGGVRPGAPGWPGPPEWAKLGKSVGERSAGQSPRPCIFRLGNALLRGYACFTMGLLLRY